MDNEVRSHTGRRLHVYVTAVLLDFRAYDTLGEATVLFCAVMGAVSVLRRKTSKQPEETEEEDES